MKHLISDSYITDIANAIRTKKGTQNTMTVAQMPNEISTIPTGGGGTDYLEKMLNGTLTSYTITNTVTEIPEYAFYNIQSLTSITIPSTVKRIEPWSFANTKITSVTLPSELHRINYYTFSGCDELVSVTFPTVLTYSDYNKLQNNAFYGCHKLTTLYNFNLSTWWAAWERAVVSREFFRDTALVGDIYAPDRAAFGQYSFYNSYSSGILNIHLYNDSTDVEVLEVSYTFEDYCFNTAHCRLVVPYSSDHSILNAYKAAFPTWSSIIKEENQ